MAGERSAAAYGPLDETDPTTSWFFENAQDLFAVVSETGEFLRANPAWTVVTGWERRELLGRNLHDFLDEDSRRALANCTRKLARAGLAGVSWRMRRQDGGWVLLEGQVRLGPGGEMMGSLRDVTAERRQARALERVSQEHALLSETAGVGLWRYDPRTRRLDWSDEWIVMLAKFGIELNDLADLTAVCHPDDLDIVTRAMLGVVRNGGQAAFSHRLRTADGGWIWMRAHVRGEPIEGGGFQVRGISQNVTELAEAREAALRGERQNRRLVEEAPFAVAVFDTDLRYVQVSPSWISIFDMGDMDFLGRRIDELAPGFFNNFIMAQGAALRGASTTRGEHRSVDERGVVRWLRWDMRPWRDTANQIVGVVVYMDDVSAITRTRREAEAHAERLKIALDAAEAAVIEIDYDENTLWTSGAFAKITGHEMTVAQARGGVWPFVHPDDVDLAAAALKRWLAGEPREPLEVRIIRGDGVERWIRIYQEIKRDLEGRWRRSIALLMDIDERKRQELALVEAERAAQAAAEAKSRFLANMSHEIRTPMNGVLGVLHLLKGQGLPEVAQTMIDEALACGGMLQALLDDVVDFSKVEAGRIELAMEPVNPSAILEAVARMVRPQAVAKGLTLTVESSRLPQWVLGDPVRLRQCLFNLVGNAVKFTTKGSVTLSAAMVQSPNGARLRFEVMDTGIGSPDEVQGRLFERFQQADASTTRRFGGSGLGLAITRRLAEQMGGGAGFTSQAGRGSTFWFEVDAPVAAAPVGIEAMSQAMLEGLRILVVEDNATNRMVATKMLEGLGADIETAEDGEQGVEAAARGGFDLILMDVQMPGIDGMEASRRIRAQGGPCARTPIIALTANVLLHQRQAYLGAGMNGVVGKPICPTALIQEIVRLAEVEEVAPAVGGAC
ncbi:MAG: PAS domain S-box protein [Caulobacteraceae bacterium]|nr:PAS domain S-box protein [Caulobacteraceae bacterium]